jgi:hypothetical protein
MNYACPAWEFAGDNQLLKLQRLQNKVLRTIANFPRRTSVRDLHMAFELPYICDYVTKLCRQQADVTQIMKMQIFATLDKANPDTGNIRGLNLAVVKHTIVQVTTLSL